MKLVNIKMKVALVLAFLALGVFSTPQGQNCGPTTYLSNAALDVTPYPPLKGQSSVLTLTGVTPSAMTLQDWDLYWNLNGRLVYQTDISLTGTYAPNANVTVVYNMTIPAQETSGYYNMKLLLQTTDGYYINCWQFNYYLV